MELDHQAIPRGEDSNACSNENTVSGPTSSSEITSSTEPQTSETLIESQTQEVDLPQAKEETGVNVNDAQTRAPPPINRTNALELSSVQTTDESGDVSSAQHVHAEEDITTAHGWDPLRSSLQESSAEKESGALELAQALELEEGRVVHPVEQEVLIGVEKGDDVLRVQSPTTATSRRVSPLHLNLTSALPSSQPWDNDAPLNSLTQRKLDYPESEVASQRKYPPNVRPLKPKSSYYFGPPPEDSAFGTPPVGQIGVHYPREMVRIERDYSGGELPQFAAIYPLEFEGRFTAIEARSSNPLSEGELTFSLPLAPSSSEHLAPLSFKLLIIMEMERLHEKIIELNETLFNPVGLNILWPRKVAFLFVGIISPFSSSSG
ncbi:hypothetical protein NP233_g8922 [Leucocoprinus birnbaumii]|uniref:Uncharacterized protein n=1 Tax=Leucocoprinus birnbaumii TaxID=56174 RepID=A0AAD5YRD7_9AGAR|nr:hypothetical protein NP233_g8922 [Leucocoprinus birnbaumii]